MKRHTFIETAKAFMTGGSGGNGCSSFRREKYIPRGGPSGGNGGDGGNVILQADKNVNSLIDISFKPHRRAQDGVHGKGKDLHGRKGKELLVKIPCGTEVWDESTGVLLGDMVKDGESLIVAKGGKGGKGNGSWKRGSSRRMDESSPGELGEQVTLRLELKLVAESGLIGLPNAGKSSLISIISHAHPKIASYPFTTLNPVIGVIKNEDTFTEITIVDIPGLIKDAHKGAGLGHKFLRHVERAGILVLVIDMAGTDGRDPADDYFTLLNELRLHDEKLVERAVIVAANKMDLPEARERLPEFERITGKKPIQISALTRIGLDEFKRKIYNAVIRARKLNDSELIISP